MRALISTRCWSSFDFGFDFGFDLDFGLRLWALRFCVLCGQSILVYRRTEEHTPVESTEKAERTRRKDTVLQRGRRAGSERKERNRKIRFLLSCCHLLKFVPFYIPSSYRKYILSFFNNLEKEAKGKSFKVRKVNALFASFRVFCLLP